MAEEARTQNWWTTLPGLLTALAGVLTAATGLVAAVKQLGMFDHPAPGPVPAPTPSVQASAAPAVDPQPSPPPARKVARADRVAGPKADPAAEPTGSGKRAPSLAELAGAWHDSGNEARGPLRMTLRSEGSTLYVHVWARCRPQACDWGEVAASALPAEAAQPAFGARFTAPDRDTSMQFHPSSGDTIELHYTSKFPDGKPDFSGTRVFKRASSTG